MDTKSLEKLGLTKAEIDVYIMLLRFGSSTATIISEKTHLNRSHIYDTLTKLTEKGLVSVFEKNKTKYFDVAFPERILDYIKDLEKEVKEILPYLKKLKEAPKPKTKVQLFEGKKGIKTILKDIIREKKDYFVFGEEGIFQEIFPIYIQQFIRDVEHNKIKEKIISRKKMRGKLYSGKTTEIRYLNDEFFSPTSTAVYGDKVAIFVWGEPHYVMLMHDKLVAESHKNHFNLLWKQAKP